MQILIDEVKKVAESHIARGASLHCVFEYIGQAAIEIVPVDHEHRNLILEGLYAQIAKILKRDSTVRLPR